MKRTHWQAQAPFVLRVLKTVPEWLNSTDRTLFYSEGFRPLEIDVPGHLASPDRRDITWVPPGMLRNGRAFVSLDYLRSYLRDEADKRKAGSGDREVSTSWIASQRTIELSAGRYTMRFKPGQKTMQVSNKRSSQKLTYDMPAPLWQQPNDISSNPSVTYLPLAPILKALHGTATVDGRNHSFKIQAPNFS